MNNLSTNNIFYILVSIFIIFLVVENYLNSRQLIATILVIIILYFGYTHLSKNQQKNEKLRENFSDYFNTNKYPYIFKTKEIYNIYIQLSFLSKYNNVSFDESALYMNRFLKCVYQVDNMLLLNHRNRTNIINNAISYSTESLNLLKSIITSLPINIGILSYPDTHLKIQDPSSKLLDKYLNILHDIVNNLKEELILKINDNNKLDINMNTTFIPESSTPDMNPLQSHGYMSNFNLY